MLLRQWCEQDAVFVCYLRNKPELMKWFRQDKKIGLESQKKFMKTHLDYRGYVVEEFNKPVAVIALNYQTIPELCWVGEARYFMDAYKKLVAKEDPDLVEAPLFAKNPLLKELLKSGFVVNKVEERVYWKKQEGLVDVIHLLWSKS